MRRKTRIQEKHYLDQIFNNNDYESPEEKAIQKIEKLPKQLLIDDREG